MSQENGEFRVESFREGDSDLFVARDDDQGWYSCVAIHRKGWEPAWPALGGTRWVYGISQEQARSEAKSLAAAMYFKNTLLRRAAGQLGKKVTGDLYGWQGGKGVIWTPVKSDAPSPQRLMFHGRLLQALGGQYIGSKDVGIGESQLRWIQKSSSYVVGLGCKVDTGEATSQGVLAGLKATVSWLRGKDQLDDGQGRPGSLDGLRILVVGAGKVGFPLLHALDDQGAEVFVYDPDLCQHSPEEHYEHHRGRKAAIEPKHLQCLEKLGQAGRILGGDRGSDASEAQVLVEDVTRLGIQIVSPNGGLAGWLSSPPKDSSRTRAQLLAEAADRSGALKLVLGAGNDQVPLREDQKDEREQALHELAGAGVWFVPDPLVSPGGVIAVSHELAPEWCGDTVNEETRKIVEVSVKKFFELYEKQDREDEEMTGLGTVRGGLIWQTLQDMVSHSW